MELTLDDGSAKYRITSYSAGVLLINGQSYHCSLLISPDELIAPWGPTSVSKLTVSDCEQILKLKPDIVIIGTGSRLESFDPGIFEPFYQRQIGVEVMDTGAACRTYTLLMAENRKVVAGIIL